jgi:hypothetical protein
MTNNLQMIVYKSPEQYFKELLGIKCYSFALNPEEEQQPLPLLALPLVSPPSPPNLPNLKAHCLALNAMMIFMNNDAFMQDVVDDMNENNPCTCGNRKYELNKDREKFTFLRYKKN